MVDATYILLLFVDVANLKPNILFGKWSRRNLYNISKTLVQVSRILSRKILKIKTYFQALLVFLLLFVDYTKAKVDLIGFFESRFHPHDL